MRVYRSGGIPIDWASCSGSVGLHWYGAKNILEVLVGDLLHSFVLVVVGLGLRVAGGATHVNVSAIGHRALAGLGGCRA